MRASEETTGQHFRLRIHNAGQIVCVRNSNDGGSSGSSGQPAVGADAMRRVDVLSAAEEGAPLQLVVGADGRIAALGTASAVDARVGRDATFGADVDARGGALLPGLADAHTHPVWSGDRVHEFALKLGGAGYMDVHRMGGGIGFTVRHTRASGEAELAGLLRRRLGRMLRCGTTLAEAKSGYGLDTATELKMLRVIHASSHAVELVGTFLGAHSVPAGTTAQAQAQLVAGEMTREVAAAMRRGEVSPTFVDVFHEEGVFDYDQTRAILAAGRDVAGLEPSFHGDELHHCRSAELAGDIGARAVSHLEMVSRDGIAALTRRPTFAVLLPTTAYLMRLKPPPARDLIAAGVPVALGTDFNPNAHCLSMPLTMNMACVLMHMSMEEALVASTLNAAAAIGRAEDYGTLEKGKWGDVLILDAPRWEHIAYELADPPITHVFKKGVLVHSCC